jgi:hypothetical protein
MGLLPKSSSVRSDVSNKEVSDPVYFSYTVS